ncbi:MAG: YihY/virulence factor BrkB family protein [Chloroflexota bacterium]
MGKLFTLLKDAYTEWSEDKAARLAAALAYYTVFSMVPMLVVVISLAGLLGSGTTVQQAILFQVGNLIGDQGSAFIGDLIQAASRPSTGIIATALGTVTLLFGALGVFGQLQESLNTIWEVQPKPTRGLGGSLKRLVMTRVISFTMILGIGFLLLVSLVVNAGLAALSAYMSSALPVPPFVLGAINFLVSFAIITLLFALMFKILPDAEIAWRDVWLGSAVTSLLFTLGRMAIAAYLGRSQINSSFGAAGSLVLILVWVYYSAQILFMGAEITQVYATKYGQGIRPDEDAIKLTDEMRAHQGMARKPRDAQAAGGQSHWLPATGGPTDPDRSAAGEPGSAEAARLALGSAAAATAVQADYHFAMDRPTYRAEQAAYEVDSKDLRPQGPVVPVAAHASYRQPDPHPSLLREVALPMGAAWLGAMLVGTLVHFSFIRGKKD